MNDKVITQITKFNDVLKTKKDALADRKKKVAGAWKTSGRLVINGQTTNIRISSTIPTLVALLAVVVREKEAFDRANALLGTDVAFEYASHSFEDWVHDFVIAKSKLEIVELEATIKKIESVIENYTPEELRRDQAFSEVEDLLAKMDV